MQLPNQIWENIIAKASQVCSCIYLVIVFVVFTKLYNVIQDVNELQNPETIKQLGHILKTNVRACSSTGHPFVTQVCEYLCMYL